VHVYENYIRYVLYIILYYVVYKLFIVLYIYHILVRNHVVISGVKKGKSVQSVATIYNLIDHNGPHTT